MKADVRLNVDTDYVLIEHWLRKLNIEISDDADVLITDYDLERIKESKIPVIVITELHEFWHEDLAVKAWAAYYLVKPVNFNYFKTILNEHI